MQNFALITRQRPRSPPSHLAQHMSELALVALTTAGNLGFVLQGMSPLGLVSTVFKPIRATFYRCLSLGTSKLKCSMCQGTRSLVSSPV